MKYLEYRSAIKSGDILVWSKDSLVPSIIRLFTKSEYSHVGIAWEYRGRKFVVEAVEPYIRIVPLSDRTPFYHIPMGIDLTPEVEDFMFSKIGKAKYSVMDAIKAYFGIKTNPSTYQCVEFSKEVIAKAGIEVPGLDIPSEFVLELQKMDKNLVYVE